MAGSSHHNNSSSIWAISTLFLLSGLPVGLVATQQNQNNSSYQSKLTYTRLRADTYYLPTFKSYQQKLPYEENVYQLVVNNHTQKFYANLKVASNAITRDELILEALDQAYYTRLLQLYIADFDKPGQRELAMDPAKVNSDRCNRELEYLDYKLNESQIGEASLNPELATFFDSYGMQESGLLLGNFLWVGQWRQCARRHIFEPASPTSAQDQSFTGRYCYAKLVSPKWLPIIEQKVKRLRQKQFFSSQEHEHQYRRYFRIQLGFCIPESCDADILKRQPDIIGRLAKHRLSNQFASYKVEDLFCLPDESSPLRRLDSSGWFFVSFSILWMLAILVCTWIHWTRSCKEAPFQKRPKGIVGCFSLIESWRSLTRPMTRKQDRKQVMVSSCVETGEHNNNNNHHHKLIVEENGHLPDISGGGNIFPEPEPADLAYMNAIKVVVVPFIVFGHIGMLTLQSTSIPLDYDAISRVIFHLLAGSTFYVDYYFCITGFLTSYTIFCSKVAPHKTSLVMWLYSIFRRYWRLAPTYLLLFWYSRSIFQFTGQGPLWDYGTSNMSSRSVCQRESWLTPLTLTSNWHPLHEECNMPTWYISMDMQFYLITPFLLYLLSKSSTLGWILLTSMISGSLLIRAHRFYTDPKANHLGLIQPRYDIIVLNQRDISDTYLLPQYRLPAYLVGLLSGHYTYMVRAGKWAHPLSPFGEKLKMHQKGICIAGFCMCAIMQFATAIMDTVFPASLEPYARQATTLLFSSDHLMGSFGPMVLLVSLGLDFWPQLREHMERPFWLYLSRISYFIYLVQIEMILWSIGVFVDEARSSGFEIFQLFVFLMFPLVIFALLATLLISNPLTRLERHLIGKRLMRVKSGGQLKAAAETSPNQSAAEATRVGSTLDMK